MNDNGGGSGSGGLCSKFLGLALCKKLLTFLASHSAAVSLDLDVDTHKEESHVDNEVDDQAYSVLDGPGASLELDNTIDHEKDDDHLKDVERKSSLLCAENIVHVGNYANWLDNVCDVHDENGEKYPLL